ncbi:unnamed protein product [Staurois parvus]|uniref:Uncharacterized protein n=1 Tax=Staurois parvus TaxID=386267 RepID=A0ABN9D2K6_9NEOB|nr:unnamed protein product [Staurois parvus]
MYKKMTFFKTFKFAAGSGARTSRCHRDRNTEAGAGIGRRRDGRGRCRGHIMRAKDKVSTAGNP